MKLDIGAGPASTAEFQIDQVKFPGTTNVMDIVNTPWPFESNFFDEVRAEQVLEHIPNVIYYQESYTKEWTHIYPRILVIKEIHRVLKVGGIAHFSVPIDEDAFLQDPTHCAPKVTEGFFSYFCREWGGAEQGSFANDAYGINFAFKKLESFVTGWNLTVRLIKE